MSRSIKKNGIIKDKGVSRAEYNRRFRRINRQRVKEGKDPKQINEITNQYDICDFVLQWEKTYYYHHYGENELLFMNVRRSFFKK